MSSFTSAPAALNVVIPMGGLGLRFAQNGYTLPKPLIPICGRSMLSHLISNLSISPIDTVHLALSRSLDASHDISASLLAQFPSINFSFTLLSFDTRGAAETLYCILQNMTSDQLLKKTISLDCDTIYFSDILKDFRSLPPNTGASFYFNDPTAAVNPIFSYISLAAAEGVAAHSSITAIAEKDPISTNANTGAYAFSTARSLQLACAASIDGAVGAKGEYYTSSIIAAMIAKGDNFTGVFVEDFVCVGTPVQLTDLLDEIRTTSTAHPLLLLNADKATPPSFRISIAPPQVDKKARMAKSLHAAGMTVKLIGKPPPHLNLELSVHYDEIVEASVGDVMSDYIDIEKEIGWTLEGDGGGESSESSSFVKARHFNTIEIAGDAVIKSGPPEFMNGELHFYENIPKTIAKLFPKMIKGEKGEGVTTITVERIEGVTFSHLMLNGCVTAGRLRKVLEALRAMHEVGEGGGSGSGGNLGPKIEKRFLEHQQRYFDAVGENVSRAMFSFVKSRLGGYQERERWVSAAVIHGDPVFTNILLTKEGDVKFLDMRGLVGDTETCEGDVLYDLAKVYQSLMGYDFIVHGEAGGGVLGRVRMDELENYFWCWVDNMYESVRREDVKIIAAAHLFGIVGLHEDRAHGVLFLELALKILESLDDWGEVGRGVEEEEEEGGGGGGLGGLTADMLAAHVESVGTISVDDALRLGVGRSVLEGLSDEMKEEAKRRGV